MKFEDFERDDKTISAVQHQILIIGEATKRLSPEFRNQHLEEIWKTIQIVMPDLVSKLFNI